MNLHQCGLTSHDQVADLAMQKHANWLTEKEGCAAGRHAGSRLLHAMSDTTCPAESGRRHTEQ